jgi:two-component system nitrogen regulation sensor histidine kinase NtrY
VAVIEEAGQAAVIIEDNGKGLPQQGRERLTEPYVTTRAKGTGLGLAIVKKIMEDHRGELGLEDAESEGARVRLVFAASETRSSQRSDAADQPIQLSAVTHGA